MLVVGGESTDVEAQTALASALGDLTGLNIEIATVARPADALAALCASVTDQVAIAWLDGLTALAAQAQDCGDPTLTAERTVDGALNASQTIQIITSRQAASFAALSGQEFCRISSTDLTTWLYPTILMRANDFDVIRDSSEVVDVEDVSTLFTAVLEGDCDAAGIPTSALASLDPEVRGALTLLEPTLDVLYSVLVYPQAVTLTSRDAINSALGNLMGNPEQLALLQSVLGIDQVRAVRDEDLESLRAALTAADLDLAQIGR
jgi:ABC-type phosphate/phosphonate transport system substrate-binding protein